jgi:ABC-type branched-subunit amino acid transport system substrate-binding protein
MKKWYTITAILAVTVIVLGMFAMACAPKPAAPVPTGPIIIKVGMSTALSGPAAPWGQTSIDPYNAWIEVFNKEGGFKVGDQTYYFKMIQIDDQNSGDGGAAAAKQLVFGDGVKFIVGHWTWNFGSIAAVTQPAKVLFFSRTGDEGSTLYNPQTMPYVVFGNPALQQSDWDMRALTLAYPNYKRIGICDMTLGKNAGWDIQDAQLNEWGIRFHHEFFPPNVEDFAPYVTRFNDAGCDIIYFAGWIGESMMFAKQRWEMGYKDMKVGCSGPIIDTGIYLDVCGLDAAQGYFGQFYTPWEYKKTTINPKYIAQCREVLSKLSTPDKQYVYTGWTAYLPSHLLILSQAMQAAGTVDDPDAIMKVIRGGTFDTPIGKWTMAGAKTVGSPVVFGSPGMLCTIQGDKEVYLSEAPMDPLP